MYCTGLELWDASEHRRPSRVPLVAWVSVAVHRAVVLNAATLVPYALWKGASVWTVLCVASVAMTPLSVTGVVRRRRQSGPAAAEQPHRQAAAEVHQHVE